MQIDGVLLVHHSFGSSILPQREKDLGDLTGLTLPVLVRVDPLPVALKIAMLRVFFSSLAFSSSLILRDFCRRKSTSSFILHNDKRVTKIAKDILNYIAMILSGFVVGSSGTNLCIYPGMIETTDARMAMTKVSQASFSATSKDFLLSTTISRD